MYTPVDTTKTLAAASVDTKANNSGHTGGDKFVTVCDSQAGVNVLGTSEEPEIRRTQPVYKFGDVEQHCTSERLCMQSYTIGGAIDIGVQKRDSE